MQKYFTKEITQPLKVILLGLVLGLGISVVSADWTQPLAPAPTCMSGNPGCDAPINVGSAFQAKSGVVSLTGLTVNSTGSPTTTGVTELQATLSNPLGLMVWGNTGISNDLTVGSASPFFGIGGARNIKLYGNSDVVAAPDPSTGVVGGGLSVDLGAANGANGRNAVNLVASQDNDSVGIIQNVPNFFLYDYGSGDRANLLAKGANFANGQVTIDNSTATGALGTDQLILNSNPSYDHTSIISNLQKLQIWNSTTQTGATLGARNVQLNDGTEGLGKVLTSDGSGLSSWQPATTSTKVVGANNCGHQVAVMCPTGYYVTAGGGTCEDNSSSSDQTRDMEASMPIDGSYSRAPNDGTVRNGTDFVGWNAQCHSNGSGNACVSVYAICSPIPGYTPPPPPPPPAPSWHYPGYASAGTAGQTCEAWLGKTSANLRGEHYGTYTVGQCAYVAPSHCQLQASNFSSSTWTPVANCHQGSLNIHPVDSSATQYYQ